MQSKIKVGDLVEVKAYDPDFRKWIFCGSYGAVIMVKPTCDPERPHYFICSSKGSQFWTIKERIKKAT